jgi:hypothetical protein
LSYSGKRGSGYGNQIRRAKNVQAKRSPHAKAIDRSLKAPNAKNVEEWLSAPNRFDLLNVDTNKPQKETKSCRVSEEYYWKNDNANKIFDRLVNKDDINDKPENKKILKKIIALLDKAKIPYYDAPNFGVQILKSDMLRAEKLTDTYQKILWKTSQ